MPTDRRVSGCGVASPLPNMPSRDHRALFDRGGRAELGRELGERAFHGSLCKGFFTASYRAFSSPWASSRASYRADLFQISRPMPARGFYSEQQSSLNESTAQQPLSAVLASIRRSRYFGVGHPLRLVCEQRLEFSELPRKGSDVPCRAGPRLVAFSPSLLRLFVSSFFFSRQ